MKRPALTFAVLTWRSGYVLKMLLPPTARRTPLDSSYERSRSASVLARSEEHTSELQSWLHLVCRLLLEKKNIPAHDGGSIQPLEHAMQIEEGIRTSDASFTLNNALRTLLSHVTAYSHAYSQSY